MGTTGLLIIHDVYDRVYGDGKGKGKYVPVATIYSTSDAYPRGGFMCWVCEYLKDRVIRSGISNYFGVVNGMDDLASVIIAYLKYLASKMVLEVEKNYVLKDQPAIREPPITAGFVYLLPTNIKPINTDAEYVYMIYPPQNYEMTYDKTMMATKAPNEWLEIPFTEIFIRAYKREWFPNRLKRFFSGTASKYYEKYCKTE